MNYKKPLAYALAGYLAVAPMQSYAQNKVSASKLTQPAQTESIDELLIASNTNDLEREASKSNLKSINKEYKQKTFWDKYKWWIVTGVIIAGAAVTYFATQKKDDKTSSDDDTPPPTSPPPDDPDKYDPIQP